METVSFHLKGVGHTRYNMQCVDRHENILCVYHLNCAGLILELKDQYADIAHNNEKHISNAVIHILITDTHKFLPLTYQMLFERYDFHVALQISYMSQIN